MASNYHTQDFDLQKSPIEGGLKSRIKPWESTLYNECVFSFYLGLSICKYVVLIFSIYFTFRMLFLCILLLLCRKSLRQLYFRTRNELSGQLINELRITALLIIRMTKRAQSNPKFANMTLLLTRAQSMTS